jgi:hypothetical protein
MEKKKNKNDVLLMDVDYYMSTTKKLTNTNENIDKKKFYW